MMTDPIPTTRLQPEQLGRYELQLQEYEAFLACLQIGENVWCATAVDSRGTR